MGSKRMLAVLATAALMTTLQTTTTEARAPSRPPDGPSVSQLVTFAKPGCTGGCGSGSAVGPDGALYVTDGKAGRVLRVDPHTGAVRTFARGLPKSIPAAGIGGAIDVTFLGRTAYVLVTVVGPEFGQKHVVAGIYRVNSDGRARPIADIGKWSTLHPPKPAFFVKSGVQYALETFHGGFVVTDGHHNRVLRVTPQGRISEVLAFRDVVPTGLEVDGDTVYVAQAGPIPHRPRDGKVWAFHLRSPSPKLVATGARLLVDVELGPDHGLYALSQGIWNLPVKEENEGRPASPRTGSIVQVERGGTFTKVVDGLDRPTSMEFIGDSAYVVTLTGKVIEVDDVPGGGESHP